MRVVYSCAFVFAALSGCAGSQTVTHAEVTELRQRLDDQARREASSEHKIDELENRVFLLTDQLESAKVASLHRGTKVLPALPVVTLKPDGTTPAAHDDTIVAGDDIEFAGAARSSEPDLGAAEPAPRRRRASGNDDGVASFRVIGAARGRIAGAVEQ